MTHTELMDRCNVTTPIQLHTKDSYLLRRIANPISDRSKRQLTANPTKAELVAGYQQGTTFTPHYHKKQIK